MNALDISFRCIRNGVVLFAMLSTALAISLWGAMGSKGRDGRQGDPPHPIMASPMRADADSVKRLASPPQKRHR